MQQPIRTLFATALAASAAFAMSLSASALAAPSCSARSARTIAPVVELYTSEGCSSCPPADRWLSRLNGEPDVVALAFHVDYWDRLGWKDRFASPAYSERQAQQQRSNGARFSYTPQVVVDGVDRKDWPGIALPLVARQAAVAPVTVTLVRDGSGVVATIAAVAATAADARRPTRLAAYWTVTEQGHVTAVKAGENDGATLRHDHVVREYRLVAEWRVEPNAAPKTLRFDPAVAADPGHPREVDLVVVDAASGRPVQALRLGC